MSRQRGRLRVVAVIPARWGAERFPGKPLAPIAGKPMIAHVVERTARSSWLDTVAVATDDERIAEAAGEAGAVVVLTGKAPSGTDRIAQALGALPEADIIVNVQGDEPLIDPAVIDAVVVPLIEGAGFDIGTAARPFAPGENPDDPDRVKVVLDRHGRALYFSRARIPHCQSQDNAAVEPLLHIGIYAFRRAALDRFVALGPSPLERCESLEQLRLLEDGMAIHVSRVDWRGIAVDRPEDIPLVEEHLKSDTL